ncbi:hypothetical protein L9F63_016164, partial [Diploptera punctata]
EVVRRKGVIILFSVKNHPTVSNVIFCVLHFINTAFNFFEINIYKTLCFVV